MCKAHDGVLYFDATTSSTGTEMWAYNHSNLTLWRVTDINSGSGDSNPGAGLVDDVIGTWLVYDAYDGGQDLSWANLSAQRNHGTGGRSPQWEFELQSWKLHEPCHWRRPVLRLQEIVWGNSRAPCIFTIEQFDLVGR